MTADIAGVPGLSYLPDYVDAAAAERLLAEIDRQPWLTDLQRRVQHYGYRYDYKARRADASLYLGPLPEWAAELARRLHAEGWFACLPDQLTVNEYQPGQGISKHVDCVPCFDAAVASLSLGSGCVLEMADARSKAKVPLYLEPRSLVVLQKDARYRWTHAVPARKKDIVDGRERSRGRRVSLTFRKVLLPVAAPGGRSTGG
jgi:alkylated DNA repair dioxygenase AlkB